MCAINCSGGCPECVPEEHLSLAVRLLREAIALLENRPNLDRVNDNWNADILISKARENLDTCWQFIGNQNNE